MDMKKTKNVQTLQKLQKAWAAYKSDTGNSQAKTAKALGMNQSAFSQYLRGEINTNTDFVDKFEKLTGLKISDSKTRNPELHSFGLEVAHTLSGLEPLVKTVLVSSFVSSPTCFGVLVDMPSLFERGSILVADKKADIREGDLVVLLEGRKAVVGNVRQGAEGWSLAIPSWGGTENSQLDKNSTLARITSSFYPQRAGRIVTLV